VVADKGTAQDALNGLVKDWTKDFKMRAAVRNKLLGDAESAMHPTS